MAIMRCPCTSCCLPRPLAITVMSLLMSDDKNIDSCMVRIPVGHPFPPSSLFILMVLSSSMRRRDPLTVYVLNRWFHWFIVGITLPVIGAVQHV